MGTHYSQHRVKTRSRFDRQEVMDGGRLNPAVATGGGDYVYLDNARLCDFQCVVCHKNCMTVEEEEVGICWWCEKYAYAHESANSQAEMNIVLSRGKNTMNALHENHTLYKIICSCPGGKLRVKGAEDLVQKHYKVQDRNRCSVAVNAFNNEALRNIIAKHNELRIWFWSNSVPWDQNAYRLIHNSKLPELDKKITETIVESDRLTKIFLDGYEKDLPKQKAALGGLADMIEWPKRDDIKDKIRIEKSFRPVPAPGEDVRTGWSEEQLAEYRKQVEDELKRNTNLALLDVAKRIQDVVGRVSDRTEAYNGTRKGSFRDSLISNCVELVEALDTLNVAQDPTIKEIGEEIRAHICSVTPDELRKDESKRKKVKKASDDILERIGMFAEDRMADAGLSGEDSMEMVEQ